VAPPDAWDEPLGFSQDLTITDGGFHVVTASGEGDAIRFEVTGEPTPPPAGPTGALVVSIARDHPRRSRSPSSTRAV